MVGMEYMPTLRDFSEIVSVEYGDFVPTPRFWINPGTDVPVKRGIRPIGDAGHVPVLDRVPMDIIEMPVEIFPVPDLMFPKPPLPYRAFPVFGLGSVNPFRAPE